MIQAIKKKMNIAVVILVTMFGFSMTVYAETHQHRSVEPQIEQSQSVQVNEENSTYVDSDSDAASVPPAPDMNADTDHSDIEYSDYEVCFSCT